MLVFCPVLAQASVLGSLLNSNEESRRLFAVASSSITPDSMSIPEALLNSISIRQSNMTAVNTQWLEDPADVSSTDMNAAATYILRAVSSSSTDSKSMDDLAVSSKAQPAKPSSTMTEQPGAADTDTISGSLKDCALPFLPGLCWNERNGVQTFPNFTKEAYVALCDYKHLSINESGPLQCLMLISSVLTTIPRHSFVLMLPEYAVMAPEFEGLVKLWNVKVQRYMPFKLPQEAIEFHTQQNNTGWLFAYQKLNIFNLTQYKRLLFLDTDMVLMENVDHVFALRDDALGCDCSFHDRKALLRVVSDISRPYPYKHYSQLVNSGLLLATPSADMFKRLMRMLQAAANQTGWNLPYGDQQLVAQVLGRDALLPPNMMLFPDVCYKMPEPDKHYPLHKYFVLHNTWTIWIKWGHWQDAPPKLMDNVCWQQVLSVNRYFIEKVFGTAQQLGYAMQPPVM